MKKQYTKVAAIMTAMSLLLVGCGSGTASGGAQSATGSQSSTASGGSAAPELVIQVGHVDVEQMPNHNHFFVQEFAARVADLSGGTIEIQEKGNSQLGGEVDMMEGMQMGTVDMAMITSHAIAPYVPQFQLFDLPYLYENRDDAWKLLDSDLTKELDQMLHDAIGITVLGRGEQGFRHVSNNVRPICNPEDIIGIKLRVPETAIYTDSFKALKSNPTPMAWSETYTGVQQGTVDGVDVPTLVTYSSMMHETLKYSSLTKHVFSVVVLMASDTAWSSYTEEQQAILRQAAEETSKTQRDFIQQAELDAIDDMKTFGVQINDDVDRAAFRVAVQPIYDKYLPIITEDIYNRAMEILEN